MALYYCKLYSRDIEAAIVGANRHSLANKTTNTTTCLSLTGCSRKLGFLAKQDFAYKLCTNFYETIFEDILEGIKSPFLAGHPVLITRQPSYSLGWIYQHWKAIVLERKNRSRQIGNAQTKLPEIRD